MHVRIHSNARTRREGRVAARVEEVARMDRSGGRALVAAIAFAALGLTEIIRTILAKPWGGMELWATNLFGIPLAIVWIATAVGLVLRTRWAWPLVVVAAVAPVIHGAILLTVNSWAGVLYMLAGVLACVSMVRHMRTYGVQPTATLREGSSNPPTLEPSDHYASWPSHPPTPGWA